MYTLCFHDYHCRHVFHFRFVRAEVLAGFINGLFLMFIAFFILSEAVEVCDVVENYFQ